MRFELDRLETEEGQRAWFEQETKLSKELFDTYTEEQLRLAIGFTADVNLEQNQVMKLLMSKGLCDCIMDLAAHQAILLIKKIWDEKKKLKAIAESN